jgi:hypothetical protein
MRPIFFDKSLSSVSIGESLQMRRASPPKATEAKICRATP